MKKYKGKEITLLVNEENDTLSFAGNGRKEFWISAVGVRLGRVNYFNKKNGTSLTVEEVFGMTKEECEKEGEQFIGAE